MVKSSTRPIDRLLKAKIKAFEQQLRVHFRGYSKYPEPARLALIDMAYNLGVGGLLEFKELKKAAEAGKWEEAARQSKRSGGRSSRNKYVKELFEAAGKKAGGFANTAEAQAAVCGVRDTVYTPNAENHAVYRELYRLYHDLHDAFGTAEWSGKLNHVMKSLIAKCNWRI